MDLLMNGLLVVIVLTFVWKMLPARGVKNITTDELKTMMKENSRFQYIDVRTPMEFKEGHLQKFKNVPLGQLKQHLQTLDKEKEIVLICRSGNRSNQAARQLKKAGFQKVINVKGGMIAYH